MIHTSEETISDPRPGAGNLSKKKTCKVWRTVLISTSNCVPIAVHFVNTWEFMKVHSNYLLIFTVHNEDPKNGTVYL